MEKTELLRQVINKYDEAKKLQDMQDPTFLSVMGKSYREKDIGNE